ncbi:unnamed protein product, partial [Ixodes pacificus]
WDHFASGTTLKVGPLWSRDHFRCRNSCLWTLLLRPFPGKNNHLVQLVSDNWNQWGNPFVISDSSLKKSQLVPIETQLSLANLNPLSTTTGENCSWFVITGQ